jgi:LmbE family N-acetylglucosaminyl deacetylase
VVVISPHLDDAVFGCGDALAARPGSTVVTVFAGFPDDAERITEWDARCGFRGAREAVGARREEDRRALALLDARPHWLDFVDSQYGRTPAVEAVADALRAALRELAPDRLLYPLGLFHSDHRLVHDAACAALDGLSIEVALAYEDALYRSIPGLLQRRLAELAATGVTATPAPDAAPSSGPRKARAVEAYASQLKAFGPGGCDDAARPERLWRLEPAGAPR